MDKSTLRKVYLEKRRRLSQEEYESRNRLLCDQLIRFQAVQRFKNVHTFLPIKKNKEPDIFPFLQYLWAEQPEVKVVTGVSDLKKPTMRHLQITQNSTLLENKWGIPEPQGGNPFPVDRLECIFVPMVTGFKNGHRIGYGKGYYDRFLQECSANAYFVGVNLGPLLEGDLYTNPYDIAMQSIITPFEIRQV